MTDAGRKEATVAASEKGKSSLQGQVAQASSAGLSGQLNGDVRELSISNQDSLDNNEYVSDHNGRLGRKGKGWTPEGVKSILGINDLGSDFLRQFEGRKISIVSFDSATDTMTNPDGSKEVRNLSLLGNFDRDTMTIRINSMLSDVGATEVLYHEFQHYRGKGEVDARILAEQFAIDMGLPTTSDGYRTPEGKPNVRFIANQFRPGTFLSKHYYDQRPRSRAYIGEKNVPFF